MQFEQIKNTIASRHSLFLYMDNIYIYIYINKLVYLRRKIKFISLDWPNALNKYETSFFFFFFHKKKSMKGFLVALE